MKHQDLRGHRQEPNEPPAGLYGAASGEYIYNRPADDAISWDEFLDGRVLAAQPRHPGHRSGLDAVCLAAILTGDITGNIFDLGAGAGIASFCLARRTQSTHFVLVDNQPRLLDFASLTKSHFLNRESLPQMKMLNADITWSGKQRHKAGLLPNCADHVIMNPPFFSSGHVRHSPDLTRAAAHILSDKGLEAWARTASDILKPGGSLALIFRADGLRQVLNALEGRFGEIDLMCLRPRRNAPASRILIRAIHSSKAPLRLLPDQILHAENSSRFTTKLGRVLRGGGAIMPNRR